MLNKSEHMTMI